MIPLSIKQLATILNGELYHVNKPDLMINHISTNSGTVDLDCAFFALKGNRFDGHNFVEAAIKNGSTIAVVSHKLAKNLPQLVVANVEKALGHLASWVRKKANPQVVSLTGSSGKTSVKEITAAILKRCGNTLYTEGNLNNEIGVPLTLLRLTPEYQYAVIELGANHQHEIAYTTKLAAPDSVLVNNIAAAHLEGFGSLEGVARAKGEIFLGLPRKGGNAFLNYDSYSPNWLKALAAHRVYFFSLHSKKADYYASDIIVFVKKTIFILHTPEAKFTVTLPLIGMHNVLNAIAAAALALSVGASKEAVIQGLLTLQPLKGRLYPIPLSATQQIFDDTYNANVGSMRAAVAVLASQPGYRVFVAGDMGELGEESIDCHKEIGKVAKEANIDCVLSFGHLSKMISDQHDEGKHFTDKSALVIYLKTLILAHPALTILIKGSRSMAMEQIIEQLLK